MSTPRDETRPERAPADLVSLLHGLAETVRHRLAPAAESEFLGAELFSLASILRILAAEVPHLAREEACDREDLLALDLAHPTDPDVSTDKLRAAAAALIRRPDARERVRGYVQRDLTRGLTGLVGAGSPGGRPAGHHPGPATGGPRPPAPELRERLRQFLADRDLGELSAIARSTEGYGAETVVCTTISAVGDKRLVVRIQWPDLPIVDLIQTVDSQACAIDAARRSGVPTAEVLAVVTENDVIGAPALVTSYVAGYVPTGWTPAGREFIERLAASASKAWVEDLVRIHATEIRDLTQPPLRLGATNVDQQQHRVARLESVYRASELRPDPLIEDVLAALEDTVADFGAPVLVHGDYRPGNIIYREDLTTAAVLDWDCAYVNDYHEDLGHVVAWPWRDDAGRVAGLMHRDEFLDCYARLSGRDVDPRGVRYYELQSAFRRYLGFAALARAWLDRGGDVRMARAWLALQNDRLELGKLMMQC